MAQVWIQFPGNFDLRATKRDRRLPGDSVKKKKNTELIDSPKYIALSDSAISRRITAKLWFRGQQR